ncbi:hypothetical protein SAMN05192568_10215 [Methylobacterium pseudosasicola]|uniref:Uncharacterized protein n=2 Tax=Methylobacterium pseudosasicola TaxID=582667 RepID=A0A1I4NIW5_9HYPH|nr:hypothetical protein SAMN05192568_10215 [Methylobacterium pseudosasicola]
MPVMRTPIHANSNGDRWYLCRGDDPVDVFVFHEPNGPSGRMPSRIELTAFLASGSGSPEHRTLLTMIGSLVGATHAGSGTPPRGPEAGAAGAEPTPGEAAALT